MLAAGNFGDWHAAVGEVAYFTCRPSLEQGAEVTDEQPRQACTAPTVEW